MIFKETEYFVTSVGQSAFNLCNDLKSIEISNSITSIESYVFAGCSGLTSVEIGNSVTLIGECAFSYCNKLAYVEIPNSVTSIDNYAFMGCSSLTKIDIPNSVASIGKQAFEACNNLEKISIGSYVTSIGCKAFYYCENMTEINCKATTPPILEQYHDEYEEYTAFWNYTATLNVPIGCAEAYRNAVEWCNFTNIQEVEFSGVKNVEAGAEFDVAVNGNEICITGIDSLQDISIYNMRGMLVYCGNDVNVSVPASGLYLVKVGNQTAKVLIK